MTTPTLLPHSGAILDRLRTWAPLSDANVIIGDHVAPKTDSDAYYAPAAVMYLRPGGPVSGSLGCPDVDAWLPFQVTCVGRNAAQAMWVADRVEEAFQSAPLVVDDRLVCRLKRVHFGAAAKRDDGVTPPLFYVPAEYRLLTLED